jgi:predicted nucleotidyltransferase
VKPLLYVYRVLLTGIHLMRTGEVQGNLVTLNEEFRLPYIADLVARKLAGPEKSKLQDADGRFPRIGIPTATSGITGRSRREPVS